MRYLSSRILWGSSVPWLAVTISTGPSQDLLLLGCLVNICIQTNICYLFAFLQLHSSIPAETAALHHLNVQCLLHQEFLVSASSVQNLSVIPLNRVIMFPGMLSNGWLLQLSSTASIPVLLHPGLQSSEGLSCVCLSRWARYPIYNHRLFLQW